VWRRHGALPETAAILGSIKRAGELRDGVGRSGEIARAGEARGAARTQIVVAIV
jgi:hypothetical protein